MPAPPHGWRRGRRAASQALTQIADPRTADVLGDLLGEANPDIRHEVVDALAGMESDAVTPYLLRASRDANAEVRRAAVEALGDRRRRVHRGLVGRMAVCKGHAAVRPSRSLFQVFQSPPPIP